jgi:peptide/nickel transport system ATP-binding protein
VTVALEASARAGGDLVGVLDVRELTKHFTVRTTALKSAGKVHAADEVSFTLRPGTITALVGESGSGKSTVARLLAKLYDPTSGQVLFEGKDIAKRGGRDALLDYRSQVQMIFQDPFGSLNPAKTIRHHIERPLRIHGIVPDSLIRERVHELLDTVGLVPPEHVAEKYPHQLSGGQRQRVAIARTLAVEPTVLLADEPTSMLDVSIRIGILNLMLELKETQRIAFLYVTHDLASARYLADDILVMYAGQIVEQGPVEEVLGNPLHPYTQLLLSAVPDPGTLEAKRIEVRKGLASAAVDPPSGCRFLARCPLAVDVCSRVTPPLVEARPRQAARCHVNAPDPSVVFSTYAEASA